MKFLFLFLITIFLLGCGNSPPIANSNQWQTKKVECEYRGCKQGKLLFYDAEDGEMFEFAEKEIPKEKYKELKDKNIGCKQTLEIKSKISLKTNKVLEIRGNLM